MLACVLGIQLLRALANKVQCGASADFSVLKKEGKNLKVLLAPGSNRQEELNNGCKTSFCWSNSKN